jgi:hypothetical protein
MLTVQMDIWPGSCPNLLNTLTKGTIPVAILGSRGFDVSRVNPSTVRLEGVAPLRWSYEDVSRPVPFATDTCVCTNLGADGYKDLYIEFPSQAIASALGQVQNGLVRVLNLAGMTYDKMSIKGKDCVEIRFMPNPSFLKNAENEISLSNNYPNPFNPETEIFFNLPERMFVNLAIYNILGEKVRTLANSAMEEGTHNIYWDGRDDTGTLVASGIYFYKLSAGEFTATRRMILMK